MKINGTFNTEWPNMKITWGLKTNLASLLINYTCLWQLLGDITAHKDSFQVDPEVLYLHPLLNDLTSVGQVLYP